MSKPMTADERLVVHEFIEALEICVGYSSQPKPFVRCRNLYRPICDEHVQMQGALRRLVAIADSVSIRPSLGSDPLFDFVDSDARNILAYVDKIKEGS